MANKYTKANPKLRPALIMSVRVTKSQRGWLNARLRESRGTKTYSELIRDLIEQARKS
jgi:hypothetical protein